MADLNSEQLDELSFISGVDANGEVAPTSFWTWRNNSPATYNPVRSIAAKWNNDANGVTSATTSTAGTASGTITYSYAANLTPAEQAAFTSTVTLWSDETNVSFTLVPLTSKSDVVFQTNVGQGTFNHQASSLSGAIGSSAIPSYKSPDGVSGSDVVDFDTSGSYGTIGSFAAGSNYGAGALTHEVGHAIGLGHAGPYNGVSNVTPFNTYDSRQYTIMSYVVPTTGADWKNTKTSQTPMLLDILAAQRLYGAPVGGGLSGGQVFGFNCNIADAAKPFFDFSTNIDPVVTLYDSGLNNTLDCSGFSTNCKINLNPGTFSSASRNDMVNNIAIAYGTRIDSAVGGSGNDTFLVNADSDMIDGGAGTNTVVFSGQQSDYTIDQTSATSSVVTNNVTGTVDRLTNVQNLQFAAPICFTTGTRIAVRRGNGIADVPVEALRVGDFAVTATGEERPIMWIGRRDIGEGSERLPAHVWPVRVRAGAFGIDGSGEPVPSRDLRLSPGHPVLVGADANGAGGVLVLIMSLINGTSIDRVTVWSVTYWHVELDAHDVLLAEGLPAESYIDLGSRPWFEASSADALHDPDAIETGGHGRCRPTVTDGPKVEAERRRLDVLFAATLRGHCAWAGADPRGESLFF